MNSDKYGNWVSGKTAGPLLGQTQIIQWTFPAGDLDLGKGWLNPDMALKYLPMALAGIEGEEFRLRLLDVQQTGGWGAPDGVVVTFEIQSTGQNLFTFARLMQLVQAK